MTHHNSPTDNNEARLRADLEKAAQGIQVSNCQPPNWDDHLATTPNSASPNSAPPQSATLSQRWLIAATITLVMLIGGGIWLAANHSNDDIIVADDTDTTDGVDSDIGLEESHIFHPEASAQGGIWRLPMEPLVLRNGDIEPLAVAEVTATESSSSGVLWVDDFNDPSAWISAYSSSASPSQFMGSLLNPGNDVKKFPLFEASGFSIEAPMGFGLAWHKIFATKWLVIVSDSQSSSKQPLILAYHGVEDAQAFDFALELFQLNDSVESVVKDSATLQYLDGVLNEHSASNAALALVTPQSESPAIRVTTTHGTVEIDPVSPSQSVALLSLQLAFAHASIAAVLEPDIIGMTRSQYISRLGPDGIRLSFDQSVGSMDSMDMVILITADGTLISVVDMNSGWDSGFPQFMHYEDQIALLNTFRPVSETEFRNYLAENHIPFNE